MSLLNILEKSRYVIMDILRLREFNVEKYENFSRNELEIMKNNIKKNNFEIEPIDMISHHNSTDKKIFIKYLIFSKIRIGNLKTLLNEMIENEIISNNDDVILILGGKINNHNIFNNLIDLFFKSHNIFIQIYSIMNLTINISKHERVPQLRILDDEETGKILEKYEVSSAAKLPLFNRSDAQAKFYGVRSGDLCEIIRNSETAGIYTSYRYMP